MKNLPNEVNYSINTEEKINELEDMKHTKGKNSKKPKASLTYGTTLQCLNISVIGIPKDRRRQKN